MKLKNTTDFSDNFLRRMILFCCRELGLPSRKVRQAEFGNRSCGAYNGRAWRSGRIRVVVGPESEFPILDKRLGNGGETIADRVEALVAITAHELQHLCQYTEKRIDKLKSNRKTEHDARWHETQVLRLFRASRDELMASWSNLPREKQKQPKASLQEKRAAKVADDLAHWQRKLKLAQTKVKKLKAKSRYYEKAIAAKRGEK